MINNDVALRAIVLMLNGVPLGAKNVIMKTFAWVMNKLYVYVLKYF